MGILTSVHLFTVHIRNKICLQWTLAFMLKEKFWCFHWVKGTDTVHTRISEGSAKHNINWRLTRVVPFTPRILNAIAVCLIKGAILVNFQEPMSHPWVDYAYGGHFLVHSVSVPWLKLGVQISNETFIQVKLCFS